MSDFLIKGIELSKIYNNPTILMILPDGTVKQQNGTFFINTGSKATEIKPHGRLGDLDALEKKVIEEADYPSYEWCTAIDQIRNAPTIVEASK